MSETATTRHDDAPDEPLPGELRGTYDGLHTRTYGSGPTVLWVHGYTMDATLWRPLWRLLPGFRHVGVDLPGHGRSEPLSPGVTLPGLAARVRDLARAEEARRWVGLSFGSTVVLQMAIDAPDAVDRLAVGAPTPAGGPPDPAARKRYMELLMLRRMRGAAAAGQLADLWMAAPPDIFRGTESRPEVRARVRAVVARHSWAELDNGAMAALSGHVHTAEELSRITADTLALTGEDDMPVFHENAALLVRALPRCRGEVVPGAGHLPFLELPRTTAASLAGHLGVKFSDGTFDDRGVSVPTHARIK
ncbi:pimeloyl-[acyl-carrier protein] methyl ester esterase [Streptomyces sp. 1222.5]|uniref:alpha/beta fold hydrolase n=1 Tax=unclassified Streptomyces TaxID=2593676 RepID=UPI00089D2BAA|nr:MULTISPECIES: alpha/beta hydrolase [unclassified Streptomyces]PKW09365.1 carboxylesterase BioH (pimeloyl-CoA synthesis) [Streptomyces sp. 5112.2]SEC37206.1 pimeloyl-[acyl-carrier protein] methyl ester esterase [Streptomyces sp. 1222.5]SED53945.1 pimeloyl-[acyl-carrier protein] methyl ester esterase [Streptomyces sp. 2231.1]